MENFWANIGLQDMLMLLVGLYLLIKGAEVLIEGAGALARRLGISDLIIALTIVAFGTSAPEMGVNLISAWQGSQDLAIGNIVGSNIANIALVLGVSGLAGTIAVRSHTVWKEIPMLIVISLLLLILASDSSLGDGWTSNYSLADGLTLLMFFCFFLGYVISNAIDDIRNINTQGVVTPMPVWKAIAFVIGGIIGLTIGGKWIVDTSLLIARTFNVSEGIIGLTLVAVGTSLPELATSVVAVLKKKSDIALGNIIGSNIFNISCVLAITILVKPMSVNKEVIVDMYWMIGLTILLFAFLLTSKVDHQLKKWQSGVLLLCYFAFIFSLYFK